MKKYRNKRFWTKDNRQYSLIINSQLNESVNDTRLNIRMKMSI